VITEDGYKIELFRIPGPRFESPIESLKNANLLRKKAVLFLHGVMGSSISFIISGAGTNKTNGS
jgi:hypothetical protein